MKLHHNTFPSLPYVSFLIPCLVPLLFWMNRNMCGCMCMLSCVWLYETPMDYSPPGPSVHGIFQARILEWAAIPFSRGYSPHRDRTLVSWVSCIGRWILYHWATETSRQLPYKHKSFPFYFSFFWHWTISRGFVDRQKQISHQSSSLLGGLTSEHRACIPFDMIQVTAILFGAS